MEWVLLQLRRSQLTTTTKTNNGVSVLLHNSPQRHWIWISPLLLWWSLQPGMARSYFSSVVFAWSGRDGLLPAPSPAGRPQMFLSTPACKKSLAIPHCYSVHSYTAHTPPLGFVAQPESRRSLAENFLSAVSVDRASEYPLSQREKTVYLRTGSVRCGVIFCLHGPEVK